MGYRLVDGQMQTQTSGLAACLTRRSGGGLIQAVAAAAHPSWFRLKPAGTGYYAGKYEQELARRGG